MVKFNFDSKFFMPYVSSENASTKCYYRIRLDKLTKLKCTPTSVFKTKNNIFPTL